MSGRFEGLDYDDDPWRSRLYAIDVDRALMTRPGLQALTDLRDALLALPEKRLALGQACRVPWRDDDELDLTKPTFCAMGAYLHRQRVANGEPETRVIEDLASERFSAEDYGYEVIEAITDEAKRLGMARSLATHIQWINDESHHGESEEQRYARVLAWTEKAIAANVAARADRIARST